jgi:signal transduction histidine kinase
MDVTEQKRMQKELLHAERFAAIGQAVAGIQHALKNMLNALKGGAYMVKLGLKKEDLALLREGWEMVEGGIENLTSMSGSMLSYLRDYKPEFGAVDVPAMVREIEGMFRETAEKKGAKLTVDVAEAPPPVHADARLVHSAVMDILSNALDACMEREYEDGEEPTIGIFAHPTPEGDEFVLSVSDNGCGMSPQVRANVFAPFFSTKKSWGTGLGLALTARTIRLHGGEIEVESEENRGSEFRIILPTRGPERDKEKPDGQEGAGR